MNADCGYVNKLLRKLNGEKNINCLHHTLSIGLHIK